MSIVILWDAEKDAAVLVDNEFETPMGRVFIGDGYEKVEAFLAWYRVREERGEFGPMRSMGQQGLCALQDKWLAELDEGCGVCGAPPWETCDVEDNPHERKFVACARKADGCPRAARFVDAEGGTWCTTHVPSGRRVVGIDTRGREGQPS